MEFVINRDVFLKSLGQAIGIIKKKTTLPILSNIVIEAKKSNIKITATDLDIIYFEEILPQEVTKEGSTTTSANILYDILKNVLGPYFQKHFLQKIVRAFRLLPQKIFQPKILPSGSRIKIYLKH